VEEGAAICRLPEGVGHLAKPEVVGRLSNVLWRVTWDGFLINYYQFVLFRGKIQAACIYPTFTAVRAALCPMMDSRHQFVHPTLSAAPRVTQSALSNPNLRPHYLFQVHLSTDTVHKSGSGVAACCPSLKPSTVT